MNPLSIVASTFIAAGAVVMTISIFKFKSILRMLKKFAVEGYEKLRLLFSFHEILMIFFLLGYLVVLYAILTNIKLAGDLFIGAFLWRYLYPPLDRASFKDACRTWNWL